MIEFDEAKIFGLSEGEVVGNTLPLILWRCIPWGYDLSFAFLILFREVREVGGTESVCFVMVGQEFRDPRRMIVREPLIEVLWAVVGCFTNCDVGTSSVCKSCSFPTMFLVNGRFTLLFDRRWCCF